MRCPKCKCDKIYTIEIEVGGKPFIKRQCHACNHLFGGRPLRPGDEIRRAGEQWYADTAANGFAEETRPHPIPIGAKVYIRVVDGSGSRGCVSVYYDDEKGCLRVSGDREIFLRPCANNSIEVMVR